MSEVLNEGASERFSEIIKYYGSVKKLQEITGLHESTIYKIIKGKFKIGNAVRDALRELNINIDWLDTGNGSMFISDEQQTNISKEPNADAPEPFKIRMYPLPVNAGFGYSFDDLDGEHYQYVSYKYRDAKRFIAMRLSGDSMVNKDNPEYNIADGFSLIIDVSPTNICKHGDIVIVLINDVLYCKQYLEENGKVVFHSFNPEYKDMKINGEYYSYKIIGKVVLFAKEL